MDAVYLQAPPSSADIVVIDDEASIREGCRLTLESEGYRAVVAENGMQGLEIILRTHPRVVLLDLRMPGISGVEVLERLPGIDPRIVPIVITGYGSIDTAVSMMKLGAFDFITKPFEIEQLLGVVDRGLQKYEAGCTKEANAQRQEQDLLLEGLSVISKHYALELKDQSLFDQLRALEDEAHFYATRLGRAKEKAKFVEEMVADLRLVDKWIEKYNHKKNALIQILLGLQAEKKWLPHHMLTWTSRRLNIPLGQILEVVNFYEAFSLEPQGRHMVQVCMGTACHVRRSPELAQTISALLGIKPGETDENLNFTFKEVHCLGCCALAPVVKVDDKYHSNPSLKELKTILGTGKKEVEKCQK